MNSRLLPGLGLAVLLCLPACSNLKPSTGEAKAGAGGGPTNAPAAKPVARAESPRGKAATTAPVASTGTRRTNTVPTKASPKPDGADSKSATDEKKPDPIKPYDKVITKEAKTQRGVFSVHRVDEKVYFEIPTNQFGTEFLWVSQVARTQTGFGYGGGTQLGSRVVRWQLRQKDVLLREVKYSIRAEGLDAIRYAVETSSLEPIIRKFPVAAWGTNQAAVIDVTELFLGDVSEFSAKNRLNASGADRTRSFLESIKAFPRNIETRALLTYTLSGGSPFASTGTNLPIVIRRDSGQSAVSVVLHHSMVQLPEKPMRPRVLDERVGFFAVGFEDYGTAEHQVKDVRYIARWRLEKKDPDAEVSEPKSPIVFYVGRGVPDKWRPWVKKGIEMWQPAFEKAGFKNAIVGQYAPSEKEDPNWDAEDARYSTIQWLPSTIENAMGPHVSDPRTGEILEADILVYHNILKLQRDWYFVQASPCDPRAQKLPLPDDLMGELLAYVVAHEVGHSLGFPHNMKASSAYTVEQLRDPAFTKKNGTEASIMDYGRFNYVAQPGDGAHLIPIIAPYDFFATEWGYREFKGATNAAQEKPLLEAIAARQMKDPTLLFGDPNPGVDPSQQTEDLGSDGVKATELGLKNIDRIVGYLVSATCKEGEDYDLLRNMYTQVLNQRDRELGHVANMVGGVNESRFWYGQADRVFKPVPADRQREAVAFLNRQAFATPTNLLGADILARLEAGGAPDRILSSQRRLLAMLLDDARCKRMAENAGAGAYTPEALVSDLQRALWSELSGDPVEIDLYRRNLQRAFIELLGAHVNRTDASSDLPALARRTLKQLQNTIQGTYPRARSVVIQAHLEDIVARIDRIFEPRETGGAAPRTRG